MGPREIHVPYGVGKQRSAIRFAIFLEEQLICNMKLIVNKIGDWHPMIFPLHEFSGGVLW